MNRKGPLLTLLVGVFGSPEAEMQNEPTVPDDFV